jgi:peroxiredoxin
MRRYHDRKPRRTLRLILRQEDGYPYGSGQAVARAYQVYRAEEGTSERALYVIDAGGIVRWSYVSPVV